MKPLYSILAVFCMAILFSACSTELLDSQERVQVFSAEDIPTAPFEFDATDSDRGTIAGKSSAVTSDCTFTTTGDVKSLDGDCTTDGTIFVPDGMTLDGNGFTITGVDPVSGHFVGAVVANGGTTAHVRNLGVTMSDLNNVCDGSADRLRGIMFEGASGSITNNTVFGINQGPSGCQEGNAIEVRNGPFDGTHPNTVDVDIRHNSVTDFQKTGIVVNGDVNASVTHNRLGASATQENLAANGIQVGFGASGVVTSNQVAGNQWKGTSDFAASAMLLYLADAVVVEKNRIDGNSDIGIFFFANEGVIDKNQVRDEGADHPNSGYDIGIGNWGADNAVTKNHVRGFDTSFVGVDEGGKNKGK